MDKKPKRVQNEIVAHKQEMVSDSASSAAQPAAAFAPADLAGGKKVIQPLHPDLQVEPAALARQPQPVAVAAEHTNDGPQMPAVPVPPAAHRPPTTQGVYPEAGSHSLHDRPAPAPNAALSDDPVYSVGSEAFWVGLLAACAGLGVVWWNTLAMSHLTPVVACVGNGPVNSCRSALLQSLAATLLLFTLPALLACKVIGRNVLLAFYGAAVLSWLYVCALFTLRLDTALPGGFHVFIGSHTGRYWLTPALLALVAALVSFACIARTSQLVKRLSWGIFAVITVVVFVLTPFWINPVQTPANPSAVKLDPNRSAVIDAIARDATHGQLNASALAHFNKTDAFFEYLQNAAQQQALVVTKSYDTEITAGSTSRSQTYLTQSGFNYHTKQFVYAEDTGAHPDDSHIAMRCVNGQQYYHNPAGTQFVPSTYNTPGTCLPNSHAVNVNDGINTGGLSAQQAQAFIAALRGQAGLTTVNQVGLETHSGKPYLHFAVTIAASKDASGVSEGINHYILSFQKATGLNAETYPYGVFTLAQGQHIDYYVDPSGKLPAYSHITGTADNTGATAYHYTIQVQYQFGTETFNTSPDNVAPIALTWQ